MMENMGLPCLNKYRISSNKRPGRLLNFGSFSGGVYSRGAFIRGGRLLKKCKMIVNKFLFFLLFRNKNPGNQGYITQGTIHLLRIMACRPCTYA